MARPLHSARRRMRLALLLLPFVSLACAPPQRDPLPEILAEAAANQSTEPPPPVVRLRMPGTATASVPLRPLRYRFDMTPRSLRVDLKAKGDMRTLRCDVALKPMSIEEDGTLRFEFKLDDITLANDARMSTGVVAKYEQTFDEVKKLFGTELVTTRGIIKEFGWNVPKNVSLAAYQILVDTSRVLRQLYPTLPEEPVGIGARWTIEQEQRTTSYRAQHETLWTVTGLSDESVDLSAKYTQRAGRQPFGASKRGVELASLDGHGDGTFHVGLAPVTSSAVTTLAIVTALDVPRKDDRPKRLDMSTASETRWAPIEWALR